MGQKPQKGNAKSTTLLIRPCPASLATVLMPIPMVGAIALYFSIDMGQRACKET